MAIDEIERVVTQTNEVIQQALPFTVMARDTGLQQAAIATLSKELGAIKALKSIKQSLCKEDESNLLLSIECAINAIQAAIQVCLSLKTDDPHTAWNALVSAEGAIAACMRAHPSGSGMQGLLDFLLQMERTFFPPQVYSSVGIRFTESFCSICNCVYGDCDHLAGMPYMGEFCAREIRKCELKEVSIVEVPANKRCIITAFSDSNGQMLDRLTLLPVPNELGTKAKTDGQEGN